MRGKAILPLLLLLASPALARIPGLGARLERGLEYHTIALDSRLEQPFWADTLRLQLQLDVRQGFRQYNKESARLQQSLVLGWERPAGDWSWLLEGRNSAFSETFQGDRERRRTLQGDLAAGLAHRWPLARVKALAGVGGDARRESTEGGPLFRFSGESRGEEGPFNWAGQSSGRLENLDRRRNRGADLSLDAHYGASPIARDDARLALQYQREDLYLDTESRQLERRTEVSTTFGNTLLSRPVDWSESRLETNVWRLRQDRLPWETPAEVTAALSQPTRESRHEDLGFEARFSQRAWWGPWEGRMGFSLRRQRQDSRYRSPGEALQTTLSRILSNRVDSGVSWQQGADSLGVGASLELRRRDTDQQRGEQVRDADYTDRLALDLLSGWRHELGPWARIWLSAGLARMGEQHLQASRSSANHENRRWLLEFRHQLAPQGAWRLEGSARTLAAYRLFQYESVEDPRSTLQRRWILEETLLSAPFPLIGRLSFFPGWRERLRVRAGLVLEDGGRYLRQSHLELLSDSANERQLHLQWRMQRAGLLLAPGLRWFSHRDYVWELDQGQRERLQRRDLFRRGPDLELEWMRQGLSSSLTLFGERVDDNARRDWNLWATLNLRLEF
ncbi:MAG: hypothetical protein KDC10_12870 [Calditrichaeota bacterium]|nr:hypothetical protein [Calditrichota bacterium]